MSSDLAMLFSGWLLSLGLGLVVARRSNGPLGFGIFLCGFSVVVLLLNRPAEVSVHAPVETAKARPQCIAVVDFKQLCEAHPMTQQFSTEWNRKVKEADDERSQLIARGDAEAVRQYEKGARTRLGDLQRAGRDAVAKEVRMLIAQKSKDWQIDVVLDTSSQFVLHGTGWTNITVAIQREISP